MKDRKGMSQVLSLIVAASVLMMTALLVIMFTSGSLTGFFESTGVQSCVNTLGAQCGAGAGSVSPPSSCYNDDGTVKDTAQDRTGSSIPSNPSSDYSCPSDSNGNGNDNDV